MTDDQRDDHDAAPDQPEGEAAERPGGDAGRSPALSNLWQMPAIILSVLLILLGVRFATHREPENLLDHALDRAERLLELEQLEPARAELVESIEPALEIASTSQRGRYHQLVGDLVDALQLSQRAEADAGSSRLLAEHYGAAVACGRVLDAARVERWGYALIALGDLEEARHRLEELESLAARDETGVVDRHRHRLLRRLVESSLADAGQPDDVRLELLAAYRDEPGLPVADEAWVAARQNEIRMDGGAVLQAIDHLLLDVRRIEQRDDGASDAPYGELYMLLGRGYFEIADYDHAEFHLQRARQRLQAQDPAAGTTLYWLGCLAMARGDLETALEHFDDVVRDFVETPSHLPARLARAEVRSILADHAAALDDYRAVVAAVRAGAATDVSAAEVADSLLQRHDAALTTRKIDVALQLVQLAEQAFEPDEVPPALLEGIASLQRQIADDMVASAIGPGGDRTTLDPTVRFASNERYEEAAEYFLRHAQAIQAVPTSGDEWAASLREAGISFDLAGALEPAIQAYREYIGGKGDDAERRDAMFRLARCYEASGLFEEAAESYAAVIAASPHNPLATSSHVPLARCYAALGRRNDAIVQLESVLLEQHALTPGATDYRDALIELGMIRYAGREHIAAIERLSEAADRYPDDPRRPEVLFHLADSYRAHALELADRLEEETATTGADRARLESISREHLERARALFDSVFELCRRRDRAGDAAEAALMRRAGIYRADCAFHLGDYVEAIVLYDVIARDYSQHHVSMFALVQIVNCYYELGEREQADAAHQRALVRLRQLPDDAFDDTDALMDREAWRAWLENAPPPKARADGARPGS